MDNSGDYKEVTLGFAEFVSQLLRETFDAIISSQSYQLERFAEINSQLNLSNELFVKEYISADLIDNTMIDTFGIQLKIGDMLNQPTLDFITSSFVETSELMTKTTKNRFRLTEKGLQEIRDLVTDSIIDQQKGILRQIVSGSNSINLVVDSGKIEAKLELNNVYSDTTESVENKNSKKPKSIKIKTSVNPIKFIKPIKIIGVDGKKDTIIIDKEDLKSAGKKDFDIPTLRITANPIKSTSSTNLYSSVEINFKSV